MLEQCHSSFFIFHNVIVRKSFLVQLNEWIVVVFAKNVK